MSEEQVEVVRRAFDAFEREGMDGLLTHLHPDIEWTTTGSFLEAATYRGHEEVRRYLGSVSDEFEDRGIEPDEPIDAGDQVLVSVRLSGRGKLSGAPVELTLTSVCWQRDGMVSRIRNYPDKPAALEALGLSE